MSENDEENAALLLAPRQEFPFGTAEHLKVGRGRRRGLSEFCDGASASLSNKLRKATGLPNEAAADRP